MQALNSFLTRITTETGSTRPAALFRMIIAALVMIRYGRDMLFYTADTPFEFMLSAAFFVFVPLMFLGLMTRIAVPATAFVAGLAYYSAPLGLPFFTGMSHHQYILWVCTLLLCFMNSDRSYSLDRMLEAKRTGRMVEERGTLWAQRLMVWQLCAVYLWTAIDKTTPEFMSGDRLERILEWFYAGYPLHDAITWKPVLAFASVAVLLVEYALPVLILARRRLVTVFAVALALHGIFFVMLTVHTYSATMLAIYLFVANPDWLHKQMDAFTGSAPQDAHA